MASPSPKGSPILKLIILILLGVLFLALYIPNKMWNEEAKRTNIGRERMEDIYRASQRFTAVNKYYTPDLEKILDFIRIDTLMVGPAKLERERLNLIPGQRDSLLISFSDTFHINKIVWDSPGPDSLVLNLEPYPQYRKMPSTQWAFASAGPVRAFYRNQKKGDIDVIVYTPDSLALTQIYGDSVRIATKDYLLLQPVDSIEYCPTIHQPLLLSVNVKISLHGVIEAIVNKNPLPDTVKVDTTLDRLVINKFRGDALTRTQDFVNRDTSLSHMSDSLRFAQMKDSLFYNFFDGAIGMLQPKDKLQLENDNTVSTSSDSISYWMGNAPMIKEALFSIPPDPLLDRLMQRGIVKELLPRLSFTELYEVEKVDTVGLTIKCPITEADRNKTSGIFNSLFGVKMEPNHGEIKNGDLSWSEKR
jgi:hypothetical protein